MIQGTGRFVCSFCHVRHDDWKTHRESQLHQEKAEGVARSQNTYQGEKDKEEKDD